MQFSSISLALTAIMIAGVSFVASGQRDMPNMPGTKISNTVPQASPSPAASPQKMEMNVPGMPLPAASPNPQASPHKMDMPMPTPTASPSASPIRQMPGTQNMHGTGSMNIGPLLVMTGNDMGVRVDSSDTNIMSMGAMGSGTAWQPSSGPMYMHYKVSGDWLLTLHYNLIAGLNRQGGPRGVTKVDSENWFMAMA